MLGACPVLRRMGTWGIAISRRRRRRRQKTCYLMSEAAKTTSAPSSSSSTCTREKGGKGTHNVKRLLLLFLPDKQVSVLTELKEGGFESLRVVVVVLHRPYAAAAYDLLPTSVTGASLSSL